MWLRKAVVAKLIVDTLFGHDETTPSLFAFLLWGKDDIASATPKRFLFFHCRMFDAA
jgi:hypothetical protein